MAAGRFRSDLFYRLSVFNVHLPPLRERATMCSCSPSTSCARWRADGKGDLTLSRDACELLRRHPWPGNIRELQNAIERSLITSEGTLITAAHLAIPAAPGPAARIRRAPRTGTRSIEGLERAAILDALRETHATRPGPPPTSASPASSSTTGSSGMRSRSRLSSLENRGG